MMKEIQKRIKFSQPYKSDNKKSDITQIKSLSVQQNYKKTVPLSSLMNTKQSKYLELKRT